MKLVYDGIIDIATGLKANTVRWKNVREKWSTLVRKLTTEHKTNETIQEFLHASKEVQDSIKDVGGYVGGYLINGKRSPAFVKHRQLVTLDLDYAHRDIWQDITLVFDNAALIHGTHKCTDENPRYRLVMPLNRPVTIDEYAAISRKIAEKIGIKYFDRTTFQVNRLMYYPSTPIDVDFYAEVQDGVWLDADKILSLYVDWKDSSSWVTAELVDGKPLTGKRQEDPTTKRGLVGSFCRTYTIESAIETFLQDVYDKSDAERYTYKKGTTSNGLIVYDDMYAYSHHSTDPCCDKLCNAYDLVRIHKFGGLDDDNANSKESTKAMNEFVRNLDAVKITIIEDKKDDVQRAFSTENTAIEDTNVNAYIWETLLQVDKHGEYENSAFNVALILANDEHFKDKFRYNRFDNKRYVVSSLLWDKKSRVYPSTIEDTDYAGTRSYIETSYSIVANQKIDDAMALEFNKNSYHPIQEYLEGLEWDNVERVDTLLVRCFGAVDNQYTREAIRKSLVGAVARVFEAGIKFDLVLTLVGKQGTKKSTFVKKLAKDWFSDTFTTLSGKDAFEQLQGAWIIEMAELAGLKKSDIETIKHFITKTEDTYRPAYARTVQTFKRQCIFIATTNNAEFLRDPTGNRRFMPVDVNENKVTLDVFSKEFDESIDLIWAEAVHLYRKGEPLYLSIDAERIANTERKLHAESDDRKGTIEAYLQMPIPTDWDNLDLIERRTYIDKYRLGVVDEKQKTKERTEICTAAIWCECLQRNINEISRLTTKDLNDIMRSVEGWDYVASAKNFSPYGKQKYYRKNLDDIL